MMEQVDQTLNGRLGHEQATASRITESLSAGGRLREERQRDLEERELRLREDQAAERRLMHLTTASLVSPS